MTFAFKQKRSSAILVGTLVPAGVNIVLQFVSYIKQKRMQSQSKGIAKVSYDLSEPSCMSWSSFMFLIPPRQSILELIYVIILTAAEGGFMTYMMHQETIDTFLEGRYDYGAYVIITAIVGLLSSYSLFS